MRKIDTQYQDLAHELYLQVDVLGSGPMSSRIAIVGEGPGESEVRNGQVWSGGAGRVLWDGVRPYGIDRSNTFATNVVKRQISLSRKGDEHHAVTRDELHKWFGLLQFELSQLPNVETIFCLGNFALEALLGEKGITSWRGSVLSNVELPNGRTGTVVCSVNPAYTLRDKRQEPVFLQDCWKLGQVFAGDYKQHEVESLINPSYKETLDFIAMLKSEQKPVSYDIEFINLETACHGLSNDPHLSMCINLRDGVRNRFSISQEADILEAIHGLFKAKCHQFHTAKSIDDKLKHTLIAQNGMFDSYWEWLKDLIRFPCSFDTLLAHHTLYPTLPHSLEYLVSQYTSHPYYKEERTTWREGGDIDVFWRYNCKDSALTLAVANEELEELKDAKLLDFFLNHVMRLQPHCVAATVHGVAQDLEIKGEVIDESAREVDEAYDKFQRLVQEATGKDDYLVNPAAHAQMAHLYYDVLGLSSRGRSVDKANRERMRDDPGTPLICKELLAAHDQYAGVAKFHNTFATSRLDWDDRMRCEYRQFGVARAPGRTSSKQLIYGVGTNLQNQPQAARKMFIADYGLIKPRGAQHVQIDPDCCFIYFDGSQAEARVVAYRADIAEWKEQFERARLEGNYDCHRALAAEMFKVPYDEVPKKDHDEHGHPTIRYIAKRCRHGLNYRMGPEKLAETTGLSIFKARTSYGTYHKLTPELRQWWRQAENDFRKARETYNAFGRRFSINHRIDDSTLESIVAFYPQSTIGDWKNRVWYSAQEDDRWPHGHARIALDVHDSLTGIAELKYAKKALSILKEYAEKPILVQSAWFGKYEKLIIPAECKMSTLDIFDKKGNVIGQDKYHRWSNLIEVEI